MFIIIIHIDIHNSLYIYNKKKCNCKFVTENAVDGNRAKMSNKFTFSVELAAAVTQFPCIQKP
jgi:hypothetical protein